MKGIKNMKKIIIGLTAILVTVIGIIFIFRNQIKENNIGECYFQETEKEHIVLDNSGIKYANNEILVVAKDNVKKKQIKNLAKKYNAEIVGYIEQTGDYQWKINSSYTLTELEEIIIKIEQENIIETAEINYISEISISDLPVQYGKEWSNEVWDEKKHSGKNWGLEAIHCISAWNLLEENKDKINPIRLGLIDSGFDTNHEDLAYAETFLNSNTDIDDINHGTHVSGIMSAISNNENGICGVYPFGDKTNPLLYGYSFRIGVKYNSVSYMMEKCAFAELILRNVKVINCSYSFTQDSLEIELYNNKELKNQVMNNAKCLADFLNRLLDKGYDFVIVHCSGNDSNALYTKLQCDKQGNVEYDRNGNAIYSDNGNILRISQQNKQYFYIDDYGQKHKITGITKKNVKNSEIMESKYVNYLTAIDNAKEYSQVYDRIIVVGSVGMETDFSKALFDNTITINRGDSGYHISTFSNLGERVDVVAPGEDIFSTVYDEKDKQGNKLKYNYAQGTSMATPHVSGIAAIVWSANNNLTGAEVKDIICSTANNLVNLGEYGSEYNKTDYKLVNAKSALEKALGIETIETTEESKNGGILNYVVEKDNEDVKIKNAQVVAVGTDGTEYKTTTDEQGHFELILPEGVYTLTITKDEYKPYTWENVEVKNEGVNYLSNWTKLEKIQNYTWHLDPTIKQNIEVTQINKTGEVNISDGYLNVRESPSQSGKVIGKLYDGDTVKITGKFNDWYEIEFDGKNGYVFKDLIKIVDKNVSTKPSETYKDESTDLVDFHTTDGLYIGINNVFITGVYTDEINSYGFDIYNYDNLLLYDNKFYQMYNNQYISGETYSGKYEVDENNQLILSYKNAMRSSFNIGNGTHYLSYDIFYEIKDYFDLKDNIYNNSKITYDEYLKDANDNKYIFDTKVSMFNLYDEIKYMPSPYCYHIDKKQNNTGWKEVSDNKIYNIKGYFKDGYDKDEFIVAEQKGYTIDNMNNSNDFVLKYDNSKLSANKCNVVITFKNGYYETSSTCKEYDGYKGKYEFFSRNLIKIHAPENYKNNEQVYNFLYLDFEKKQVYLPLYYKYLSNESEIKSTYEELEDRITKKLLD